MNAVFSPDLQAGVGSPVVAARSLTGNDGAEQSGQGHQGDLKVAVAGGGCRQDFVDEGTGFEEAVQGLWRHDMNFADACFAELGVADELDRVAKPLFWNQE